MKEQIEKLCKLYSPLNGDLYIGLNSDIDYSDEDRIVIGWEELGGDVVYVDSGSHAVKMDCDWGAVDLFNSIEEFISFTETVLSLKEENRSFGNSDELNEYFSKQISGYKRTDENFLMSICSYLK